MAEVGVVTCASVALRVGQAVLLAFRRKCSDHCLTPPQLLAVLCLMRDEDWTVREAEVRLAGHRERRAALRLPQVPDDTTPYRCLRRLDAAVLEPVLSAAVERLLPQPRPQATVAVEATGLTPGAVSPFLVTPANDREPGCTWCSWLKWMMAVEVDRRVSLAQTARRGPTHGCATWRPLVSAAHARVPMAPVRKVRHHWEQDAGVVPVGSIGGFLR